MKDEGKKFFLSILSMTHFILPKSQDRKFLLIPEVTEGLSGPRPGTRYKSVSEGCAWERRKKMAEDKILMRGICHASLGSQTCRSDLV